MGAGGDIDDGAATLGDEHLEGLNAAVDGAEDVDLQQAPGAVGIFFPRQGLVVQPGVVDEAVEGAELSTGAGDELLRERPFADRTAHGQGFAAPGADFVNQSVEQISVNVVDHHPGALPRQVECQSASNATTGARDNDDFAYQFIRGAHAGFP